MTNKFTPAPTATATFVELAEGMGVPARRVNTAEELAAALREAFTEPGPHLIEAILRA